MGICGAAAVAAAAFDDGRQATTVPEMYFMFAFFAKKRISKTNNGTTKTEKN